MSTTTHSKSTTSTSTSTSRPGTAPAKAAPAKAAPAATKDAASVNPNPDAKVNAKTWEDLPANPSLQKPPREKTTLKVVLDMTSRKDGATLAEIKAAFGTEIKPHMTSHDPRSVMAFMSRNRGWGFRMDKDGKVHLVTA